MIPYTEQVACLVRELGMRKRVYPRLVSEKRLTQEAADREIARLEACIETIRRVAQAEPILGG